MLSWKTVELEVDQKVMTQMQIGRIIFKTKKETNQSSTINAPTLIVLNLIGFFAKLLVEY